MIQLFERRSVREQIEDGDLELTERDCPSCSATLAVEEGRLVDVYRCPECRFEGPEAPWIVIRRRIRAFLQEGSG